MVIKADAVEVGSVLSVSYPGGRPFQVTIDSVETSGAWLVFRGTAAHDPRSVQTLMVAPSETLILG